MTVDQEAIVFDQPGTEQSQEFLEMCDKHSQLGWYLNVRQSGSPMLHRASCQHKREEDGDFARNPKIFHPVSKGKVLDCAKRKYGFTEDDIQKCKDCEQTPRLNR